MHDTAEAPSPLVVSLTPAAASEVAAMKTRDPDASGKVLRVFVEAGGCSGMQYGLVFDEKRPDDTVHFFDPVEVVVDPFSSNYLRGAVVDFSESLTAGGFKISNPNARQNCGCGKSFEA